MECTESAEELENSQSIVWLQTSKGSWWKRKKSLYFRSMLLIWAIFVIEERQWSLQQQILPQKENLDILLFQGHDNNVQQDRSMDSGWLPNVRTLPPLPEEDLRDLANEKRLRVLHTLRSPLDDRTIPWRLKVNRTWWDIDRRNPIYKKKLEASGSLHNSTAVVATDQLPPAMLVLTKFGWNQNNRTSGRFYLRSKRQRELLEGLTNHPWFHPLEGPFRKNRLRVAAHVRYYIFLDMETCFEKNYPNYLSKINNKDRGFQRAYGHGIEHKEEIQSILDWIRFNSTKPRQHKLIVFDCLPRSDRSKINTTREHRKEHLSWTREFNQDPNLVLVSQSATKSEHHLHWDMGLPPGACTPCELSRYELESLRSCRQEIERAYLMTFVGNFRAMVRQSLRHLHDGIDVLIGTPQEIFPLINHTRNDIFEGGNWNQSKARNYTGEEKEDFKTLLLQSKFAAVPRGDNLFSFRFQEALSCGAIPVVYANGWVFPFRSELVNASEYAVVIREEDANQTLQILTGVSMEDRCRMRHRGAEVYNLYMKTGVGVISGIVDALELLEDEQHGRDRPLELPTAS